MLRAIAHFLLAAGLLLSGCCRETKKLQGYWLHGTDDYVIKASRVDRDDAEVRITYQHAVDTEFEDEILVGAIGCPKYGFWLELTNKKGKPIRLLWEDARYLDEVGERHAVYAYRLGDSPYQNQLPRVPPSALVVQRKTKWVIAPLYKTQRVCLNKYEGSQITRLALVPTNLTDLDRFPDAAAIKTYVDDLARRQVPVKLILPIEIEGQRHDYAFTFVLSDRGTEIPR